MREDEPSISWFYSRDGRQKGPFDAFEFMDLVSSGAVQGGDRVWRTGWPAWRTARDVPDIHVLDVAPGRQAPDESTPPRSAIVTVPDGNLEFNDQGEREQPSESQPRPGFEVPAAGLSPTEADLEGSPSWAQGSRAAPQRAPARSVETNAAHRLERHSAWLTALLLLSIVVDIAGLISGAMQYRLLTDFEAGVFPTQEATQAAANANDLRERVIGFTQFALVLVTIAVFAAWIYRANDTARRLGAQGMRFTPGWAVGWHFIPIASFWKPYQAMREIWSASQSPDYWQEKATPAILPWWWVLFLTNGVIGNVSARLAFSAATVPEIKTSTIVSIIAELVAIPAALVAMLVVRRIQGFQSSHAADR